MNGVIKQELSGQKNAPSGNAEVFLKDSIHNEARDLTIQTCTQVPTFAERKNVLQLRLQQRRSREQLASQGIMPPLKSPSPFHEQKKSLERVKTEDYLKHKIRNRPEHTELVDMHILQDSTTGGSIQATQMKLKRARLADNLNEKIALRPGPLELVEKNIIPVDSAVKEAFKGTQANFSKSSDAFAFEEDSSNDGMSPEQVRSEDSQGSTESATGIKMSEAVLPTMSGTTQDHSLGSENDTVDSASLRNSQPESPKQLNGQQTPPGSVTPSAKSKSSNENKNRHKKPKELKPKVKKLKYHQYIPPDQKAEKSPPPMDSAYARLLQQQQLFLQLQILSQQQQHRHQQHFSYPGSHSIHLKQPNEQMAKTSSSSPTTVANSPLSPGKGTFSGQSCISSLKPGPLPSNLDDLKVSELRQQLRIRGLPVSGTKTALMERLRPFQECSGGSVPGFNEITTVTFPVTPTNSLSSYQSQSSTSLLSNGFYHFGSTSSTPPISPASSDLSVNGSLPDSFNEGPMSSPQFVLHPSPVQGRCEENLMGSGNRAGIQLDVERVDTEKDKMLVEKQKVINELTWKLQQEQRQVEELRMQLQKRKRSHGLEEKQPSSRFFGFPIKQESPASSCPFASKQAALKAQASNPDMLGNHGTPQLPQLVNSHCMESSGQNGILSSTFLSPQCSPQHSPLEAAKSPQHISLPPSPNSHYLLSVSPSAQGEGRSSSPQPSSHLRTAPVPAQGGQKCSILSPSFCKSNAALPEGKQPPPYADAVKQMTRSQQMDELLDVLIETGEMPANAKEDRPCLQKVPQITVSSGTSATSSLLKTSASFEQGPSGQLSFEHCPSSDSHLEILLNSHSPLGRSSEIAFLKVGGEEPHFKGAMEGFSSKTADELLAPHEILPTPLSPMETQLSPSSAEGFGLHVSFTESPWETMEWLDLTPPSSANGFGSLTTTGPSIFNIDFLDVTDLNLNSTMDLHLQQW
ncbi:myocardin isoform X2 [Rhineura floridana]|uniref:myocardin isoform X2 n=1 Tax=Rhineura floridana TaxID=261503 RepID=UPI002AC893EC|nr:myocardin isoform X2 [Rhineura floridana]